MTAPKKYRRRPLEVEAMQFVRFPNGHTSGEELAAWCGGTYHAETLGTSGVVGYWVTVEGVDADGDPIKPNAMFGDFVIQDSDGNRKVLTEDAFWDEFEDES